MIEVVDWGFLYKQSTTWAAIINATPTVSYASTGRIGSFRDSASSFGIGRLYLAVNTQIDKEDTLSCEIGLTFNTFVLSPTVRSDISFLSQNWGPALSSSDWTPQNSSGYSSTYDSTETAKGSYLNSLSVFWGVAVSGSGPGNFNMDGVTYFTAWRLRENGTTPTGQYSHCLAVECPPHINVSTRYSRDSAPSWFAKSSLIGSAEIGPNTQGGMKTNNKYGAS